MNKENKWKGNDFKYSKEVQYIVDYIYPRIEETIKKFVDGNFNSATIPAFELGLMADLDECLDKILKEMRK